MRTIICLMLFLGFVQQQESYAQLPGNSLRILADYNYVSVPDASSNLLNNTMTIEAWVYYECTNGAAGNMIMSKGWCAVPDYSFYFNIVGQRLRLKKIRNGTGGCSATGDPIWETNTDVIPFNTWVHVALSIDASASTTVLTFYVDGVAVPHTLISGIDGAGFNASPYPLLIGTSRSVSNIYSSISGNLDDIRIWHTIRTQAEIQASKDAELAGNEVGLYAYWKLNESGSGPGISAINSATATAGNFNGASVGTASNVFFIDNSLVPDKLPTCDPVLWLKADEGVVYNSNNEVSSWYDQSGLNNHASMPLSTNQPRYKTHEINNRPVVRFDGIDDYLYTPSINLSTIKTAEIFYVAKSRDEGYVLMHNNNPAATNAFSVSENYTNGTNGHSAFLSGNTIDNVTYKSTITDSCYHMMNVQFDKSLLGLNQIKMYRNQALISNTNGSATGAEMTNNLGNSIMSIGGTALSGYPFLNTDIAEIIVYNKILTTYERITVYNYLNNKYFTNKVSTQFSGIPAATLFSNEICDDDTWRHSFNSALPDQVISSVKSPCLTFDQRIDSVFVETNAVPYAGGYFMRRHYVLNPSVEYSGTKTVRLYYSSGDYNDLQNYVPSLTSHAQLEVTKYDGLNEDGVYDPSGGNITLIPSSQIINGVAYGMYYLQFEVDHFSEFWIHAGSSIALPVRDLHLRVMSEDGLHRLSWNCTGCENNIDFKILESSDAVRYFPVKTIQSDANTGLYQTDVPASSASTQYFIIESNDIDGQTFRSNTCAVSNKEKLFKINVHSTEETVQIGCDRLTGNLRVYNMSGQEVVRGDNKLTINKHSIASGLYVVILVESGVVQGRVKFAVD